MKKALLAALLLILSALPALAQDALPQGVLALCEAKYPGYTVARSDGWGDETRGQYALVLTDGEDNILCIAEKAKGEDAYAFTVENTNAVHEGAQIPSLLIDTGGDALFYAYTEGNDKVVYDAVKNEGEWSRVGIIHQDFNHSDYDIETYVSVRNNHLIYSKAKYDKLENPMDSSDLPQYMDVPVSSAFADSLALATFDIDLLSPDPSFLSAYPGLCEGLMEAGDTLLDLDVQADTIIMKVQKADGTQRLRITGEWNEYKNNYDILETQPLPDGAYMDAYHTSDGQLFLHTQGGLCIYIFTRSPGGRWLLSSVQAESDFGIGYNYATQGSSHPYRNDGCIYGVAPWSADLFALDFDTLPRTQGEALAMLDRSRYAVVNNPNPADRLHLRTKPQKGAASLGKFYNRTPVYVIDNLGEWAFVRIGSVEGGIEGWMMTEYLAFGYDADSVACAFPQMHMLDEETPLRREPKAGLDPFAYARAGHSEYFLIGVVGEEWYVVMTPDGTVGYARQAYFWEGNG